MDGNKIYKYTGFYFVLLSFMLAIIFYFAFGIIFEYGHPFFDLKLLPLFLVLNIIIAFVIYLVSFRESFKDAARDSAAGARTTIIVLISALILSAFFPVVSFFGIYPYTMAVPHLLILFYAGISFSAISLTSMVILWRKGLIASLLNQSVFLSAVAISLGVSGLSLYLIGVLQTG